MPSAIRSGTASSSPAGRVSARSGMAAKSSHRCVPDGRAAQHPAPPGGRRDSRRHWPARDRRLGLHHQPTLGRGLALALSGAADLADTIGEYPADPVGQALALDRLVGAHVVPFYHDQAVIDAARLAMMRHTIFGAPPPRPSQTPGRVTYSQLRAAASYDPTAFRAFWKINGMICPPGEVYTDPTS
jgi:hypothetical protein